MSTDLDWRRVLLACLARHLGREAQPGNPQHASIGQRLVVVIRRLRRSRAERQFRVAERSRALQLGAVCGAQQENLVAARLHELRQLGPFAFDLRAGDFLFDE